MENIIYLNHLPKWESGTNKGKIDWSKSINSKFKCIYEGIEYNIDILSYLNNKDVVIKYKDYHEFKIYRGDLQECKLGKYLHSIPIKNPELIKYFINDIEEAKNYTCNSHAKIFFKCPICGKITKNKKAVYSVYVKGFSCDYCSDGYSYSEKLVLNIFEQLNIDVFTQLNKSYFSWCKNYKYDFYIPILNMIIETHGRQHYEHQTRLNARTLKEEQKNDGIKKQLATYNGIKEENYIVIDCRKSELNWIKENILKSRLNELFDLSKVDWTECDRFACSNLLLTICNERLLDENKTTNYFSKKYKIHSATVTKYLNRGNALGLCKYDGKDEFVKRVGKAICVYKDNILIDEFNSILNLCNSSLKIFGVEFDWSGIDRSCRTGNKYKNYNFKLKEAV